MLFNFLVNYKMRHRVGKICVRLLEDATELQNGTLNSKMQRYAGGHFYEYFRCYPVLRGCRNDLPYFDHSNIAFCNTHRIS